MGKKIVVFVGFAAALLAVAAPAGAWTWPVDAAGPQAGENRGGDRVAGVRPRDRAGARPEEDLEREHVRNVTGLQPTAP